MSHTPRMIIEYYCDGCQFNTEKRENELGTNKIPHGWTKVEVYLSSELGLWQTLEYCSDCWSKVYDDLMKKR